MAQQSREIPLYTLAGVKDAEVTTHYFETDDKLGLSMLRFRRGASGDAVVIAHGLTTSTDMFIMPEHYNLVSYLLDNGFGDVWCLDFRMSNRHDYNMRRHRYNMDDIALYDMPAAIATVRHPSDKDGRFRGSNDYDEGFPRWWDQGFRQSDGEIRRLFRRLVVEYIPAEIVGSPHWLRRYPDVDGTWTGR